MDAASGTSEVGGCSFEDGYGWLSKLWSLLGYPKYWVPYYTRDKKRTIILTSTHMFLFMARTHLQSLRTGNQEVYRGYIIQGLYGDNIGTMEKKMETTI